MQEGYACHQGIASDCSQDPRTPNIIYSVIKNGTVDIMKTALITIPIFIGVYVLLYLFMKYIGDAEDNNAS